MAHDRPHRVAGSMTDRGHSYRLDPTRGTVGPGNRETPASEAGEVALVNQIANLGVGPVRFGGKVEEGSDGMDRLGWRVYYPGSQAMPPSQNPGHAIGKRAKRPAEVALARQLDLSGLTWMLIQPCDRRHSVGVTQN